MAAVVAMTGATTIVVLGAALQQETGTDAGQAAEGSMHDWFVSQLGPFGTALTTDERYDWLLGGRDAPGWMSGEGLPPFVMAGATEPGLVVGHMWAGAPGPLVSPEQASALGQALPAGAALDWAGNRLVFTTADVHLGMAAGEVDGAEVLRVGGMVDPTVVVPLGARVTVRLVNADPDSAHGVVVMPADAAGAWAPMSKAAPSFPGAALWFLGTPTLTRMHAGTLTFTASTPGTFSYACPVPGHARQGMAGLLVVEGPPPAPAAPGRAR